LIIYSNNKKKLNPIKNTNKKNEPIKSNKKFECGAFRHNLCIISINICTMRINYVKRHNVQRIFLFIVF